VGRCAPPAFPGLAPVASLTATLHLQSRGRLWPWPRIGSPSPDSHFGPTCFARNRGTMPCQSAPRLRRRSRWFFGDPGHGNVIEQCIGRPDCGRRERPEQKDRTMGKNGNAGCLCGHVRLKITGEPATVIQCHCTDCQKSTGGGAVLVVMIPRTSVTLLQGTLSDFSVTGESGHEVKRCFARNAERRSSRIWTSTQVCWRSSQASGIPIPGSFRKARSGLRPLRNGITFQTEYPTMPGHPGRAFGDVERPGLLQYVVDNGASLPRC